MTMIPGKDASLEHSISRMTTTLEQLGFDLEEVHWLNPVPNVWSVHIRDRKCPILFTNGRGSSKEAALASALGEFVERLGTNYFFADYYLGDDYARAPFVHYPNEKWFPATADQLPAELLDEPSLFQYDMKGELKASMLVDLNSGNTARGICALPFTRQRTGATVWFPVNVLGNLYVSNGMAAGNNKYEARVQALSEIFERHIKNTILSSGISLPRIPDEVVAGYPAVQASIDALRDHGFVIVINDASLAGKFPLVNATLINPENGGCFAAFGAHPKFEVALERAVAELLQGRALNQLAGFQPPTFDLQDVADPHNLETHFIDSSGIVAWDLLSEDADYEYTPWNTEGDSRTEFEHLCYLIHRVDMDIYITDYEHLGIYCCRIVVPGMSEVYPVDELLWSNNNRGLPFREACLRLNALSSDACGQLLDELEDAAIAEQEKVTELVGIAPDANTAWANLRVGELKSLLALRTGDLQQALDWNHWVQGFGQLPSARMALHRCLGELLSFALDEERQLADYQALLQQIHGEERFSRCQRMLEGDEVFADLPVDDGSLNHFATHRKLLSVYEKVQKAKRKAA
ncbi:30S ribosomal protein S12 methylthiotransferase accessory factor YcaO [Marinobacterium jannaschii]|uniref:30S ribosomal protein S12 methylthiotransferase accessory factor YcaO n=1 Tax=Marinobacterium jannaschii TaxID=64970 RepID=UPI000488ED03|nr:30S ribosomal protein S12 methylthiotransferase accessory factor YcaO [Marinobacterium jannaschii]